jgi:hypothetical protein
VSALKAVLPPTAIAEDYPYSGEWYGITPSRNGVFISLGGYLGLTIGWIELNFLGGVLGFDNRRPALNCRDLAGSAFRRRNVMAARREGETLQSPAPYLLVSVCLTVSATS